MTVHLTFLCATAGGATRDRLPAPAGSLLAMRVLIS